MAEPHESLADAYARNGYVIQRGVYDRATMREWKRRAAEDASVTDNQTGVRVWMLDTIPDYFREQFTAPALVEPIVAILGSPIEFLSAKPVLKSGKVRFPSPWHQDYAYWGGANKLSVWIALDPATRANGCLRVLEGGHRAFIEHDQVTLAEGFGNRIPGERLPEGRLVDCVLDPGDAIFFHDLLPHCSYANPQGIERWSMIPTYRSATVPDSSTTWTRSLRIGA